MTSTSDEIRSTRLDNGLTVLFESMPWLESASVSLLIPAGSVTDPTGLEGSASVLYDWTNRGAGGLDNRAFTEKLDALGAWRGGSSDREYSVVSASLLASALPRVLPLLADQVIRPELADAEFDGATELVRQELRSLTDRPSSRLFEALNNAYFESGHGRSSYGTEEGLAALTPSGVRQDFEHRYSPDGAVLAVAGGCDWDELLGLVDASFADWRGNRFQAPEVRLASPHATHVIADTSQQHIGLNFEAAGVDDADWYLQSLAVGVLSGGMGARLFTEVREKRGLAYSVGAAVRAIRGAGFITAYAGTTPERASETLSVLRDEFVRLSEGVREDELERARMGSLSNLVMHSESSSSRSKALAGDQYLRGVPRTVAEIQAAIEAVTLEQVNSWLAQRPLPEPFVVTLGPDTRAGGDAQ